MTEELISTIMVFGTIGFIIAIFAIIIWRGNQRIAKETGKKPLYKATCGGQIGWFRYRGPFIQLRMYEDFLVIGYIKHIVLRYDEIDEIYPVGNLLRRGVEIKHHKKSVPQRLQLSDTKPDKVLEVFEQYSTK